MTKIKMVFAQVLLTIFCFSHSGLTWSEEQAIILNSDVRVGKYLRIQKGIESGFKVIKVINLKKRQINVQRVEEIIQEEEPDVVFSIGGQALKIGALAVSEKTPIVFASLINWRRFPLTDNISGVANELPPLMQLTLFHYYFPEIKSLGVIYSKTYNRQWFYAAKKHGKEMNIHVIGKEIHRPSQLTSALREILPKVDAMWAISDPVVFSNRELIGKFFKESRKKKKPVFAYNPSFKKVGAAFTISVDESTVGRQAAMLAASALETGVDLAQKVQPPAGTFIMLNMKKVKEYGVVLNIDALGTANMILE